MLKIFMLSPSGFCAGVQRAINTVEQALDHFGAPIYVKHQIVHNRCVVEDLTTRGVVFTNDLSQVPEGGVLIFNAHGVTQEFEEEVKTRNLTYIDATCPLVKKVHREATKLQEDNHVLIIIGHADHPEVIATKSRISGPTLVIHDLKEAEAFNPDPHTSYAFVTQTTLSVDYINYVTAVLKKKVPNLVASKNICYATQNRQSAIKEVLPHIDGLIVVGSQNSSNSNRLQEIGTKARIKSFLVDKAQNLPLEDLRQLKAIAISAGASSPASSIADILQHIQTHIPTEVITYEALQEDVEFVLPRSLRLLLKS